MVRVVQTLQIVDRMEHVDRVYVECVDAKYRVDCRTGRVRVGLVHFYVCSLAPCRP